VTGGSWDVKNLGKRNNRFLGLAFWQNNVNTGTRACRGRYVDPPYIQRSQRRIKDAAAVPEMGALEEDHFRWRDAPHDLFRPFNEFLQVCLNHLRPFSRNKEKDLQPLGARSGKNQVEKARPSVSILAVGTVISNKKRFAAL
jgi:hypothetical protein